MARWHRCFKNSTTIDMLPCFPSEPKSGEADYSCWYLTLLRLLVVQTVQFAAEAYDIKSSMFSSVVLLFGHKYSISEDLNFLSLQSSTSGLILMTNSTQRQFSDFAMGRHYGLDILPAFVYTSCCLPYELQSADMLVVIIDMRDGGMVISKMGRLWDPRGLLLVSYQVSSPGRKHIPWDPGGIAHELEKSWHWLEGKPVVKEGGVSAALYPFRAMGHLSLGQQR